MLKENEVETLLWYAIQNFLAWPLTRQLTLSHICLHKTLTPLKLALNTSLGIFWLHVSVYAVPLLERPSLSLSLSFSS